MKIFGLQLLLLYAHVLSVSLICLQNCYSHLFNSILALFWLTFPLGIHNLYTDFVFHIQWSHSSCILSLTIKHLTFSTSVFGNWLHYGQKNLIFCRWLTCLLYLTCIPLRNCSPSFNYRSMDFSGFFYFFLDADSQSKSPRLICLSIFYVILSKPRPIFSLHLIWSLPLE